MSRAGQPRRGPLAARPLGHRVSIFLVVVAGTALLLAAMSTVAFAATTPTREFDTQLTRETAPGAPVPGPLGRPATVAIDGSDNAWALFNENENGAGRSIINAYDPAGGYLRQQADDNRSFAFNQATETLFVVNETSEQIDVFDSTGTLIEHRALPFSGDVRIAIDNSGGATQGRYYLIKRGGFGPISAFEADGTEHQFSGSGEPGKEYIQGNQITGTPSGPLGSLSGAIATDVQGDIYVYDASNNVIDEFDSTGTFVREFTGTELPGGFGGEVNAIAIDPTNGNLLAGARSYANEELTPYLAEFSPSAEYLGEILGTSPTNPFHIYGVQGIAVNSAGFVYVTDGFQPVAVFLPVGDVVPEAFAGEATDIQRTTAELHAEAGPARSGEEISSCRFEYVDDADFQPWADNPYAAGSSAGSVPCLDGSDSVVGTPGSPITASTALHAGIVGIKAGLQYHWRISVTGTNAGGTPKNVAGQEFQTPPAVTDIATGPATDLTNVSATLHGSFTGEASVDAHFYFEYGTTAKYGHQSPSTDQGSTAGAQNVSPEITELLPHTTYHYRLVVVNDYGLTAGEDQTFTTDQAPVIEGASFSGLTATSAILHARLNPQALPIGSQAECHFEYGATAAYGVQVPCPEALGGTAPLTVEVEVTGLESGTTYHFRFSASNKWGAVTSEDQTFEFFPQSCPNSVVRQQTGAVYLPDCRAYELVSPGNANGTLLYPGGPNSGRATSPSRFSYTGAYSSIPGENTINTAGDLYVASRTSSGWQSKYIGLPGSEAGCMGGPPTLESTRWAFENPAYMTNTIAADPSLGHLMIWLEGTPINCVLGDNAVIDGNWQLALPSLAPYMYRADGSLEGRLPNEVDKNPSALEALKCPYPDNTAARSECSGDVSPSADLSHFTFSSRTYSFAENGITGAPGSAYDDDIANHTVTLISRLASGKAIPQDPAFAVVPPVPGSQNEIAKPGGAEEYIRFPAISSDGSHILMSTATAGTPVCGKEEDPQVCPRFTDAPVHLYLSIDDAAVIEIAEGRAVNYVGMTADGSEVYFTSEEHLTGEDLGHEGSSLYMWSEGTDSITLISKANPGSPAGAGDTGQCEAAPTKEYREGVESIGEGPWVRKCGIEVYSPYPLSWATAGQAGNGISDSAIADNGDIYFFSPEQLDGDHGVAGQQNLYDYRAGSLRFITTLDPDANACFNTGFFGRSLCGHGALARMEISPGDTHMGFVTASKLTGYESAGHQEMYMYSSADGSIICVSCRPDGKPAVSDVQASKDGLFMANDGRTFFSTAEALVPQDTNHGVDVYEYVDGRPRLITPGTGTGVGPEEHEGQGNPTAQAETAGLAGVSADGTDVYFGTFDSLIPEDHNGNFYRFYDARTDGGFAQPAPLQPCAAAEECHGPGTEPPQLPAQGTAAGLSGGNISVRKHHAKKHHGKTRRRGHRRAAGHGTRGGR